MAAVPPADASPATPRFALVVAVAFALVAGAVAGRHELWLDETQSWLIAGRAASLGELFAGLRYEGHPPLWHLVIYAVSRVWSSPAAMQAISLGCATAAVGLLAWRSPLTRAQKALFAFGYFPLFEYGVVSRTYAVSLLLVAAFVALRHAGERRAWALGVPLVLLAQTSAYGMIVAWALGIGLAWAHADPADDGDRLTGPLAGVVPLIASTAAALAVMWPPPDGCNQVGFGPAFDPVRAAWALAAPFSAALPLPVPGTDVVWNSSPFLGQPGLGELALVGGVALLVLGVLGLGASAPAAVAFGLGAATLVAFSYLAYAGSLRHFGHYLLLWWAAWLTARPSGPRAAAWLLRQRAAAWRPLGPISAVVVLAAVTGAASDALAKASAPMLVGAGLLALVATVLVGPWPLRAPRPLLTGWLALHALIGLFFAWEDWRGPFSAAAALAAQVPAGPARELPLWVADTTRVNHLGPALTLATGRPAWYLGEASAREQTYLVWDRQRPPFRGTPTAESRLVTSQVIVWRLARQLPAGTRAVFATEVLLPEFPPGLRAERLAVSQPGMVSDEPQPMALYLVTADPSQGASCPL